MNKPLDVRRLARTVLSRSKLHPPIDVEALASQVAKLEYDVLPDGVSALVVDPQGLRTRPTIIVSSGESDARRRFTLAHELGHIHIVGHVGLLACHVDQLSRSEFSQTEIEANQFAAELLMPQDWAQALVARHLTYEEAFEDLRTTANVSKQAAFFSFGNALQPNRLSVLRDSAGRLVGTVRSPNSIFNAPTSKLNLQELARQSTSHEHWSIKGYDVDVFAFDPDTQQFDGLGTIPDSRALLRQIVGDLYGDDAFLKYSQSVNGVIGASNGKDVPGTTDAHELAAAFELRFRNRAPLREIVRHPQFRTFLFARASEIISRRTAGLR